VPATFASDLPGFLVAVLAIAFGFAQRSPRPHPGARGARKADARRLARRCLLIDDGCTATGARISFAIRTSQSLADIGSSFLVVREMFHDPHARELQLQLLAALMPLRSAYVTPATTSS
jgi:hypothetical protein